MSKFILALALLAGPALAQNMSAADMAHMGIGPAIQHGGPVQKPIARPAPPIRFCGEDGKCITVAECRKGGPRPCRKSSPVPQ